MESEELWNYENVVGRKKPGDREDEAEVSTPEEAPSEPEAKAPDSPPEAEDDTPTKAELLSALAEKTQEIARLREQLERVGKEAGQMLKQSQDQVFMREIQDVFGQDPLSATVMIVERAKRDVLQAVDERIQQIMANERNFERFLGQFLRAPGNEYLQPYEHELEYLILEKRLSPHEAAEIVRTIEARGALASQKRAAADREIRKRSVVESGDEVSSPISPEEEFDRVLKKSKTVDEMFAGLNKFRF